MNRITFVLVLLIAILTAFRTIPFDRIRIMPECTEDVSIYGSGDFQEGLWDHYNCGPAWDDL